jgi:alpha-amylase/alpha-mannosidase (GH57 family)
MSSRALCIHGHFYQPPRQDVLTGQIPRETGTAPYQNWNEKIHAECYRPNAELGNFSRISFNIGPTLFHWMEDYDPQTYGAIIRQDQENIKQHGVGNAMAQSYNHTILPLANRNDKITQIRWGISDFIHRFGHRPTGMWFPEAAVDLESMGIMADQGIQYTVLAPWQAKNQNIDVRKPYRVNLGTDKSMIVFFYHMELSTRVSFDPASTNNADLFITNHVIPNYRNGAGESEEQILLIASDGELYGHHQPFRDKFLERMVDGSSSSRMIDVVYPGLYLKQHPFTQGCEIQEDTSWSCHHGVDRWKTECACTPNAGWKEPLRKGLNQIAERIDRAYIDHVGQFAEDPQEVRNRYIQVILGQQTWREFSGREFSGNLTGAEMNRLNLIMQAQIARQWMFTSCGWFFDEFDRIEPRNNVAYAAQAVYLMEAGTGSSLYEKTLKSMEKVVSQRTGLKATRVFTSTYKECQKNTFRPEV